MKRLNFVFTKCPVCKGEVTHFQKNERFGEELMEEELDLSGIGFPVLSDSLEEDLPLQLCACPYCRQSYWVIPRPEYYFKCSCGGMSIFDGFTMRAVTAAEYRLIKSADQMKTTGNA